MILDRLGAAQVHAEFGSTVYQTVEILIGMGIGIGMNDAQTDADTISTPRKNPGVTRGSNPAADDQDRCGSQEG